MKEKYKDKVKLKLKEILKINPLKNNSLAIFSIFINKETFFQPIKK